MFFFRRVQPIGNSFFLPSISALEKMTLLRKADFDKIFRFWEMSSGIDEAEGEHEFFN